MLLQYEKLQGFEVKPNNQLFLCNRVVQLFSFRFSYLRF